jgi:hypothetical protein
MGINKRTVITVRCDVPIHVGNLLLPAGEAFHLLYHESGKSVVVCENCWENVITAESVLRLIGQTNSIQKVKKDEGEVES